MKLYLVPTPIGNLGDITNRAIDVINSVDYVACEDTRVSGNLLHYLNIKKPFIKHHKHNEKSSSEHIINLIESGSSVAYISDAGMPAISDPGKALVKLAIERGVEYTVLPGASAVTTAYSASLFENAEFYFVGFVDRKKRRSKFESLSMIEAPLIFYEAPHRIQDFLSDALRVFGSRRVSVIREISKMYETYIHSNLEDVLAHSDIVNPKGEFVVVIDGFVPEDLVYDMDALMEMAREMLNSGEKKTAVAKKLAKLSSGYSRNDIYDMINDL